MSEERQQPRITAANAERVAAKRARLATELRANLMRRKAQARERAEGDPRGGGDDAADRDGTP